MKNTNTSEISLQIEQGEDTKNLPNILPAEVNKSITFKIFSFFKKPITNVRPDGVIDLQKVYQVITSQTYTAKTKKLREITDQELRRLFKASNFDYVTFNGAFTERKDGKLIDASNLFIIDIDHLGLNLQATRLRLIQDKILSPKLLFISPSGDGLKVVVGIDSSILNLKKKNKIMAPIWEAVNTYISTEYADLIDPNEKNDYIDGSGKDLSRSCFLCYDETAYLNIDDSNFLGQKFIEDMLLNTDKKENTKGEDIAVTTKDNRGATIEDMAERHLLKTDNHHPQLLSFTGACISLNIPKEQTLDYIKTRVHISDKSAHKDFAKVEAEVADIYKRYDTNSEGIEYLSSKSFGYKILFFKGSGDSQYVASSLFWDEVLNVLHRAGFAKRKIGKNFLFIQITGCFISEVTSEIMRNFFIQYIKEIENSFCFTYKSVEYNIPAAAVREIFLKNSNSIFNDTWLEHLQIHNDPVLKDSENEMYFPFINRLVTVSKDGVTSEPWNHKNGICIWEDQVIQRDFEYVEDYSKAHFYEFLNNVTENNRKRFMTMETGLGYLLHHHFRESEGQAVVFYDQTITDTRSPMGGSGKGLIVNAIKQVRRVCKVDGKHLDIGNRFRWEQVTPSTQVVWLDDVKPEFDFAILHSNLTDGWTIERKYRSQFLIEPHDSPKTVICSNSIIKGGGTTNKRRQFIIELSDFYSKQIIRGDEKPIEETHGCLFFSDTYWSADEWNKFYSIMMHCAHQYFIHRLVPFEGINVDLNRFRQATDEDFAAWVMDQNFRVRVKYETKTYYNEYVPTYYGESHQIGQRKFTSYLKEYGILMGWVFEVKQSNGTSYFTFLGKSI